MGTINLDQVEYSIDKVDAIKKDIDLRFKLFTEELEWEKRKTKNENIEAYFSNDKRLNYPVVRCKVKLNCSAEELYNFLVKDILETAGKWNPAFQDAKVLDQLNEHEQVLLMYYQKPPARAREDLFYRVFGLANDTYFERSIGIKNHPQVSAPRKKAVRSGLYFCTKDIKITSEKTCLYNVIWQYDPKGKIGSLLPKSMVSKLVLNDLLGELDKLQKKYA